MIGKKIEDIRLARRLSKTALAEKSGIDRTAIWKIENGTQSPTVTTLEALATALDVEVAIFFEERDELNQQSRA